MRVYAQPEFYNGRGHMLVLGLRQTQGLQGGLSVPKWVSFTPSDPAPLPTTDIPAAVQAMFFTCPNSGMLEMLLVSLAIIGAVLQIKVSAQHG